MAKFMIEVRNTVYETYIMDIPDDIVEQQEDTGDAIEEYFYELDDHKKYLVSEESYSWEIDEVIKIEK